MGTNFYLVSKSKKLMRKYFAVEKEYGITDEEYKIVDEPYHGRYGPIDSDTCFEVKSELILAVKSSFYHAVINDLFVSAYLGSRTAGKEDNIPVFLGKMLEERERLFKAPYL